ncbi:FAR1-related protein [Striga asiatica]|uniref:FAR1-related protein n=1 Tax=Striga asiatica TaxID=4170 RepID=A0A5A7Q433_STRAF|nr:FAR1-related protein [Striga asiatica]
MDSADSQPVATPSGPSQHQQLVITPGGTKYWIPQCEDSIRPRKGQVFRTLTEAVDFYRTYASAVGFDVRQSTLVKAMDKTILWRYLVCSREGTIADCLKVASRLWNIQCYMLE